MSTTAFVFDPWSPAVQVDPYPFYSELRAHTPVCRIAAEDAWVVTRYDDVKAVTTDHTRFSVKQGLGVRRDLPAGNILVQVDPPVHTRSRRALQPLFSPKVLGHWRTRAQAIADDLVDDLLAAGGHTEFKGSIALPLVLTMTTEMMGLPDTPAMRPRYALWSRRVMEDLDRREGDSDLVDLKATLVEAMDWFGELLEERRRTGPNDPPDLIDGFIATSAYGHTEYQITELATAILAAGLANTADMMCHGALALAENPDQFELLKADPDRLATETVDEAVRFGSPAHCVYRLVLDDVEMSGTVLPKDSRVMTLWGSANHDECVFPDPGRFDILRDNKSKHLGWGAGVHRCIGEHIGRLEGAAIFRALATKASRLELDGPVVRYSTSAVRGFDRLPLFATAR
ncbi:MAG: cytochrome P450 [Actinobacteria bacterium]|nr:cytochrome P450 [Actinomycetota bacterium]